MSPDFNMVQTLISTFSKMCIFIFSWENSVISLQHSLTFLAGCITGHAEADLSPLVHPVTLFVTVSIILLVTFICDRGKICTRIMQPTCSTLMSNSPWTFLPLKTFTLKEKQQAESVSCRNNEFLGFFSSCNWQLTFAATLVGFHKPENNPGQRKCNGAASE